MFIADNEAKKLQESERVFFHSGVAKLLYLSKCVRPVLYFKKLEIYFSGDLRFLSFSRDFSSYATHNLRKKISSFFGVSLTIFFL
jgi:hypothetical protein